MSTANIELQGQLRHDKGKGASRRLRRLQDQIPAIIYGGKEAPLNISLDHKKMLKAMEKEAFYSQILSLMIDGKSQKVILKDLQRHPFKQALLHADFQRVKDTDIVTLRIPIHFIGESTCPGVKQGGIINHQAIDVEVRSRANAIPEFIEIDLSQLELDQAIHLSDLKLPEGVEIPGLLDKTHDLAIVSVHMSRVAKTDDPANAGDAGEGDASTKSTEEVKKGSGDKSNTKS